MVLGRILGVVSVDERAVGLRQILIDRDEVEAHFRADFDRGFMSGPECALLLQVDVPSVDRMGKNGTLKRVAAPGRLRYGYRRSEVADFQKNFSSLKRAASAEGTSCNNLFWRLERDSIKAEIGGKGIGARFYRITSLACVVGASAIEKLKKGKMS
jgi:hypothetical protein